MIGIKSEGNVLIFLFNCSITFQQIYNLYPTGIL